MSRFFSSKYDALEAYTPGEQPRDLQYVKLNTNESPFPPSPGVIEAAAREAETLRLYSDPESAALTAAVAERYGVSPSQVLMTNGSDEILNFAFMAFGDARHGFVFPDITYGFYPVFAAVNAVPFREIPLRDDFTIDVRDYCAVGQNIVIANPNAPTGLLLSVAEIEEIVRTNPEHVVVIDEAYIDFGGESCVPLLAKYENLLVTQTFSKSRSLAGARLGFGIGAPSLIQDLNTIKYSTNPYNVNRMTAAAGAAAIADDAYYRANARIIMENRAFTQTELQKRGFAVLDSAANFLFAKAPFADGETLYRRLKARGILIRHWNKPRIGDWCRITVGTRAQMEALLAAVDALMKEETP